MNTATITMCSHGPQRRATAQLIYNFFRQHLGDLELTKAEQIADELGISEGEYRAAWPCAQEHLLLPAGIYVGTKKGRRGGYRAESSADDRVQNEVRKLREQHTVWTRQRARADAHLTKCRFDFAGSGTYEDQQRVVSAQEVLDRAEDTLKNIVTSLARHRVFVGHLAHLGNNAP